MFATGNRSRLQLRGLADGTQHARYGSVLRPQIYARLRGAVKLIGVISILLFYAGVCVLARLTAWSSKQSRVRTLALTSWLCRNLLRWLNINCSFANPRGFKLSGHDGLLLLPNHISYVDVIVIAAFVPSAFVTSREIEKTPVLGQITKAGGCAFVERRHKWQIHQDIDQLTQILNSGCNLTLFPEGSTSPGDQLMEFKRSLLESAVRSRCKVVPVCIRYERIDGQRYDHSNRDAVAWYGDMKFFPHLWQLVMTRSIDVSLTLLSEVSFRGHKSRRRLAHEARVRIADRFHAG